MNMNKANRINSNRILVLMASIEKLTGTMFHERYPELEEKFWAAYDSEDSKKLTFLVNKVSRLLDDITRIKEA